MMGLKVILYQTNWNILFHNKCLNKDNILLVNLLSKSEQKSFGNYYKIFINYVSSNLKQKKYLEDTNFMLGVFRYFQNYRIEHTV